MRKLYKMEFIFSRKGTITGMFVSTDEEVKRLYKTTIYFGEVLGKHSDIQVDLQGGDIITVTDDQEFIDKYVQLIGDVGYNPFDYIQDEEDNIEE
ncbi:hypothetical protein [Scytonema sp. NUACC26]|uniref:hypothetical protein n=1 Tax=Scytonema sp. NUACC26 TaxID=3140176 RepID=UPI0034DBDDF8